MSKNEFPQPIKLKMPYLRLFPRDRGLVYAFCGNYFAGTFVGTLVGTTPENGLKMRYFHAISGKLFPAKKHEKIPRCVIFKHLGIFTKVETEGLEPATSRM